MNTQLNAASEALLSSLLSTPEECGKYDVYRMVQIKTFSLARLKARSNTMTAFEARHFDYSEGENKEYTIRVEWTTQEVEVKIGRKWLPLDYFVCALNPQAAIYL